MKNIKWIDFKEIGDNRGSLVAIEVGNKKEIPFEVKRLYFIHKTDCTVSRGFHAHKELKQVAFAISGSCEMILDDGTTRSIVNLNSPTKGILIENYIWREMHKFSNDCILLVLASEHYDEEDYIRDYDDFIGIVKK